MICLLAINDLILLMFVSCVYLIKNLYHYYYQLYIYSKRVGGGFKNMLNRQCCGWLLSVPKLIRADELVIFRSSKFKTFLEGSQFDLAIVDINSLPCTRCNLFPPFSFKRIGSFVNLHFSLVGLLLTFKCKQFRLFYNE